jgi:magnesium transporter
MINSMAMTAAGEVRIGLQIDEFTQVLGDPAALLWVDLSGQSEGRFEPILRDIFAFHPLAIDDALVETHIPKVDDWGEFLYIVLRGIRMEDGDELEIIIPELDIFLGQNFMLTYHDTPLEVVDTTWELCQRDKRYLSRGSANLFYRLADELVNHYLMVIERMDESIDDIEDVIFDDPRHEVLNRIFRLKRALLVLRRTLLPQREVFNKLSRGDFELIEEGDRVYFRDVYDHMVRFQEINENLRDLISSALDSYLSMVNNRMNEIMKTLTIITTLFMPLSFLTGFFGMNFFQAHLPLETWTGQLVFKIVIAGFILIPIAMYLWMRRRAWM